MTSVFYELTDENRLSEIYEDRKQMTARHVSLKRANLNLNKEKINQI